MKMRFLILCALLAALRISLQSQTAQIGADRPPSISYQWNDTKMTGGGFITGIVFHPTRRGLAYCRTDIGGAYRWDDSQQRWIPLTDWVSSDDSNLLGIEAIALDPTDPARIYLAAGTYTNARSPNGFVLRSRNQGKTFDRIAMPFKMGGNEAGRFSGDRMAVDPDAPNILLLGSRNDGLWRSEDSGSSWHNVESFPFTSTNHIGIVSIVFAAGGHRGSPTPTIYAAASQLDGGLFRSTDAGANWIRVPGQPVGLLITHAAMASDGFLYLSYGDTPGPSDMKHGSVWRLDSANDGWTEITPEKPGADVAGFGYSIVALDPSHPQTLITATMDRYHPHDEVFRSTDRGAHWKDIAGSEPHDAALSPWLRKNDGSQPGVGHWIGSLAIDPFVSGHVLYGTGETMWGTVQADQKEGPIHWTVAANGIEETAVLGLLSPPSGPALFSALGDISGFRHDSLDITPKEGNLRDPYLSNTTSIDYATAAPKVIVRVGQVWTGTNHGGISRDGGTTWQSFPTEPQSPRGGGSVAISADARTVVWVPYRSHAWYSTDDGRTWKASDGVSADVSAFADRVAANTFYAFDSASGALLESTDGGASFHGVNVHFPPGRRVRIVLSPENEFWISSPTGLQHGPSVRGPFASVPSVQAAYAIGFGKAAGGSPTSTLFLSGRIDGSSGIYRSTDHGATWVRLDDEDHHYGFTGVISGDPKVFGRVYLGTNGRGIPYGEPLTKVRP